MENETMENKIHFPRVLMYHSISPPEGDHDALCTSPERFEAQMLYLKRHNLRGVSMRELYLAMSAGDAGGLVGITFDDGYEDFLSAALPTLERLGFSATVFVVAGMLGKENTWEHRGGPRRQLRLLEANGVREISERGMEVGSHTVTHPRLPGLDPERLVHEVSDSRQLLGEIVGAPVGGFCYPYGNLDSPAIQAARRAGYLYAVGTKKSIEYGLYDWPRTYVGEKDSPLRLGVKLRTSPFLTRLRKYSAK
jgi:peptidoglycan/xylan/chitin deacetylase (PgdA/CDA1 family)